MDRKEYLKTMVTNLVHDKNEEAASDFHEYLKSKMRDLVNAPAAKIEEIEEVIQSEEEIENSAE